MLQKTPETVTTTEVVLMITTSEVKKLLKLAQAVKDAQGGWAILLSKTKLKN